MCDSFCVSSSYLVSGFSFVLAHYLRHHSWVTNTLRATTTHCKRALTLYCCWHLGRDMRVRHTFLKQCLHNTHEISLSNCDLALLQSLCLFIWHRGKKINAQKGCSAASGDKRRSKNPSLKKEGGARLGHPFRGAQPNPMRLASDGHTHVPGARELLCISRCLCIIHWTKQCPCVHSQFVA